MPCRFLRTKKMYTHGFDAAALDEADSSTACYLCVVTLTAVGPDDDPAAPERCQPGRPCFAQDE